MDHELQTLISWHLAGQKVALAIVAETWGSAPRPAGSLMVIRKDQAFEGSVSGGCVEGAVIAEATELMHFGGAKRLNFSVADSEAWGAGLACGGQIRILLLAVDHALSEILGDTLKKLQAGKDTLLEIDMKRGTISIPRHVGDEISGSDTPIIEGDTLFLPVKSKPKLVVIGAVHIAQHLVQFANESGFAVTVVDPRGAFTDSRVFGKAEIVRDWPDDYLNSHEPDGRTAVVTLTHDPKLDDAALKVALRSDAFYIGALGSRKTHGARIERLKQYSFDTATLTRIQGPAGLKIGAVTPAEIALSIMAEIICIMRTGNGI
ncbi:XdhC family protein [Pseudokordiimonas caeni]|uniref:XdhC family protein n=1 Tax=Pseudokordiimonas caeni TaxID=2997908 RepID=UPI002810C0CB|nr:XdhC family protein [Pseudokordiimonas caeni]